MSELRHREQRRVLQRIGRFVLHYIQMCAVMCVGAVILGVLFSAPQHFWVTPP